MKQPGALSDADGADDASFRRALAALPSVEEQAWTESKTLFGLQAITGNVNEENVCAIVEDVTDVVVDKFNLAVGSEDNAIAAWDAICADLLNYATASYPETRPDDQAS